MIKKLILVLLLIFSTFFLFAGKGEIKFIETYVDLQADGKAVVTYTIQWNVVSGEYHGFYFEGHGKLRLKFLDDSHAFDDFNNRFPLKIENTGGGKYKVILNHEIIPGVSKGKVTFKLIFETDFAEAGYLENTVNSASDSLTVFSWSPVIFDEAYNQEHYTLYVKTPGEITVSDTIRQYVMNEGIILTEEFVNEKFLIDYRKTANNLLELVFHKENPGNKFNMHTQFYMPGTWFSFSEKSEEASSNTDYNNQNTNNNSNEDYYVNYFQIDPIIGRKRFLIGLLILFSFFILILLLKHKSMIKAHKGLDDISWANADWTAPKLILSDMRKNGKIAENLTPLETAFYLGISIKRIISSMVTTLEQEGYLLILSENPLKVSTLFDKNQEKLPEYEKKMFECFADDGELSQEELEAFTNQVIKNIQDKAWDCDIEATKDHFTGKIRIWADEQKITDNFKYKNDDFYWFHWYYHSSSVFSSYRLNRNPYMYEYGIPLNTNHLMQGSFLES